MNTQEIRERADVMNFTCADVYAMCDEIDSLKKRLEASQKERDEYKVIVDSFPKTADGITIVPGMKLHAGFKDCFEQKDDFSASGKKESFLIYQFYSTREAAQTASKL